MSQLDTDQLQGKGALLLEFKGFSRSNGVYKVHGVLKKYVLWKIALKFRIKNLTEMSTSGSCTKTDGNIKILRNATLDFLDNLV